MCGHYSYDHRVCVNKLLRDVVKAINIRQSILKLQVSMHVQYTRYPYSSVTTLNNVVATEYVAYALIRKINVPI